MIMIHKNKSAQWDLKVSSDRSDVEAKKVKKEFKVTRE